MDPRSDNSEGLHGSNKVAQSSHVDEFGGCKASLVKTVMENIDILPKIFDFLPAKYLNTMTRVCHLWNDIASRIKTKRQHVGWTFCDNYSAERLHDSITADIQKFSTEPHTVLVFASSLLFENRVAIAPKHLSTSSNKHPRAVKLERVTLEEYLAKVFPAKCKIFGVATDGVVGTHGYRLDVDELESQESATCLMLPSLPDLSYHPFQCNASELEVLLAAQGDLRLLTDIKDSEEALLTLMFYSDPNIAETHLAPARMLLENQASRVVAGGYVDSFLNDLEKTGDNEDMDFENVCHGFVFAAPKGCRHIQVASTFIDPTVKLESHIKAKLQKLKDTHCCLDNCIGFMFACIARGEEFHRKSCVESSVFRSLFPNVPLFGFFGNGEIGHHYLPDYEKESSVRDWESKRITAESHHAYTTIFVLLSLGPRNGKKLV